MKCPTCRHRIDDNEWFVHITTCTRKRKKRTQPRTPQPHSVKERPRQIVEVHPDSVRNGYAPAVPIPSSQLHTHAIIDALADLATPKAAPLDVASLVAENQRLQRMYKDTHAELLACRNAYDAEVQAHTRDMRTKLTTAEHANGLHQHTHRVHTDTIDSLRKQVATLDVQLRTTVEQYNTQHQTDVQNLQQAHDARVRELEARVQQHKLETITECNTLREQLSNSHAHDLQLLHLKLDTEQSRYERLLQETRAAMTTALKDVDTAHVQATDRQVRALKSAEQQVQHNAQRADQLEAQAAAMVISTQRTLEDIRARYAAHVADLSSTVQQHQTHIAELTAENLRISTAKQALDVLVKEQTVHVQSMRDEIQALEIEYETRFNTNVWEKENQLRAAVQDEVDNLHDEISALQATNDALVDTELRQRTVLSDMEHVRTGYEAQKRALLKQEQAHADLQHVLMDVRRQCLTLEEERARAKAVVVDYARQLGDERSRIRIIEQNTAQQLDTIAALQDQLQKSDMRRESEVAVLFGRCTMLEQQCVELKRVNETLGNVQTDAQRVQAELKQRTTQLQELRRVLGNKCPA